MITSLKRTATAVWKGTGLEGKGSLTTLSGALSDLPYSTKARFQNEDGTAGTNPEELIAAAHAGCFTMALSFQLNGAGFTADLLKTEAKVLLSKDGNEYTIAKIELHLTGQVPGISEEKFNELALRAKQNCPVSRALGAVEISLEATVNY